jgi:hypothetical protein
MAENKVIFVMHKAVVVRDSDRPATKGYQTRMGDAMDSRADFVVREADEREAEANAQKLKDAVDRRVEELQMKAAVERRVAELRQQARRGKG